MAVFLSAVAMNAPVKAESTKNSSYVNKEVVQGLTKSGFSEDIIEAMDHMIRHNSQLLILNINNRNNYSDQ